MSPVTASVSSRASRSKHLNKVNHARSTTYGRIVWDGALARGAGTLTSGSGALDELPVTWASRTERPDGKTSPEELIAAAHASCFAMALALVLGENDTPPDRVRISAACTPRGGRRAASHDGGAHRARRGPRGRGSQPTSSGWSGAPPISARSPTRSVTTSRSTRGASRPPAPITPRERSGERDLRQLLSAGPPQPRHEEPDRALASRVRSADPCIPWSSAAWIIGPMPVPVEPLRGPSPAGV